MRKTKAVAVLITCATLVAPICAGVANATTYTLANISCATEDCSMTGTFDYNGSFANIDITMTGAVFPGRVFNTDEGSSATQLFVGDNNAPIPDYFVLNFLQPLNGVDDTVVSGCGFSTQGSASAADCTQFFLDTFKLTGSAQASVSATPIPAALPLFAGGAGLIGLLARRRKRKAAFAT